VVIGTDCIGSHKSNYHTITTRMAPQNIKEKSLFKHTFSEKCHCKIFYYVDIYINSCLLNLINESIRIICVHATEDDICRNVHFIIVLFYSQKRNHWKNNYNSNIIPNEWHVILINIDHASMQKKKSCWFEKSAVKWNIVQAKGRQSLSDYLRKISSVLVEYKVS